MRSIYSCVDRQQIIRKSKYNANKCSVGIGGGGKDEGKARLPQLALDIALKN